jgi:ATP-dependent Clp protease adaptor protein ClpS
VSDKDLIIFNGSDQDDDGSVAVATKPQTATKRPDLFNVILLNDDFTPMEFVIDILVSVFRKSSIQATQIMMSVHKKGKGIAGTYPLDIAETKQQIVQERALSEQHPLRTSIERA